jgi:hypothetical protein
MLAAIPNATVPKPKRDLIKADRPENIHYFYMLQGIKSISTIKRAELWFKFIAIVSFSLLLYQKVNAVALRRSGCVCLCSGGKPRIPVPSLWGYPHL